MAFLMQILFKLFFAATTWHLIQALKGH